MSVKTHWNWKCDDCGKSAPYCENDMIPVGWYSVTYSAAMEMQTIHVCDECAPEFPDRRSILPASQRPPIDFHKAHTWSR